MTCRITRQQLTTLIGHINKITGSPTEQWESTDPNNKVQNVGHFLLDWNSWHDRVTLARITSPGGGISHPLAEEYFTVRELFHLLHAYIRGLQFAKENQS